MAKTLSIIKEAVQACDATLAANRPKQKSPTPKSYPFRGRAAVVTLGCAKNQVDSELMLGALAGRGFEIVSDINRADVAVVNTCGFLQSAVKESIDCVLELSELKKSGQLRKLIVAGCAVERYKTEIQAALPEADSFLALDDLLKVAEVAGGEFENVLDSAARPYLLYDESNPRVLSTASHTAYLKIAEGCNRPCTFCIIPQIRGEFRSRSIDSLLAEVKQLAARDVKEINLVAQDLSAFGNDRKGPNLTALLRAIDKQGLIPWVRLLYAYPIGIEKELLSAIVELPSVCEYLDLPLQHVSEALLKVMKRPLGRFSPRSIAEFIKSEAPTIALRTTFIVGFPGETEQDISELEQFISEGYFSSLGVFTYSPEIGTPAAQLDKQIPAKEKKIRRERLMQAQQKVVRAQLKKLKGQVLPVLLEGVHQDTDLLLQARTRFQAPEVDGVVLINDFAGPELKPQPGHIGQVEITGFAGYDLIGTLQDPNAAHRNFHNSVQCSQSFD